MYYVQRAQSGDEPRVAAERLVAFLVELGFRPDDRALPPCFRLTRGHVANALIAIGPQYWGVTVDVRVELAAGGGSQVDLAWSITVTGQFCGRADMAYWRTLFAQVRSVLAGETGDPKPCRAAALKACWINGIGSTILTGGLVLAVFVPHGAVAKTVAFVAVCLCALPLVHFGPVKE